MGLADKLLFRSPDMVRRKLFKDPDQGIPAKVKRSKLEDDAGDAILALAMPDLERRLERLSLEVGETAVDSYVTGLSERVQGVRQSRERTGKSERTRCRRPAPKPGKNWKVRNSRRTRRWPGSTELNHVEKIPWPLRSLQTCEEVSATVVTCSRRQPRAKALAPVGGGQQPEARKAIRFNAAPRPDLRGPTCAARPARPPTCAAPCCHSRNEKIPLQDSPGARWAFKTACPLRMTANPGVTPNEWPDLRVRGPTCAARPARPDGLRGARGPTACTVRIGVYLPAFHR